MHGLRIGMGIAAVAVLGAGVHVSGTLERDSRARVEHFSAAVPPEPDASGPEHAAADDRSFAQRAFDEGIVADATAFGVAAEPALSAVREAQAYSLELEEPKVIAPGRSWSSSRLEVTATIDKVKYQKHGATVSARHLIAEVKNISEGPIAYRVRVSSEARGRCDVHGARQHNAMALMPGEVAEIVVCAGAGKVRLSRAEVLEISELGHRYLSRVPPRAVGVDGISSHAHAPTRGSRLCETVDVARLSLAMREGLVDWVDIADFYSRHSCDRFRFFDTYRYAAEAPSKLPAEPPAG